jgi:hypothetical protein
VPCLRFLFLPTEIYRYHVRGTHTPRFAHSARRGRRISYVRACTQRRRPVSFVFPLPTYPFGERDCKREENKQKQVATSDMTHTTPSVPLCPTEYIAPRINHRICLRIPWRYYNTCLIVQGHLRSHDDIPCRSWPYFNNLLLE